MSFRIGWPRISFGALHSRDYRWFWSGQLGASAIFQLFNVVQGWLVFYLTGSSLALGIVSAFWSISMFLLSPYGGVIADRVDKRKLLVAARTASVLNSAIVGTLVATGVVQVWHLAISSLLNGAIFAFMMSSETSIISELVDRETLLNANAVNSVGMGVMGIVCAGLAGWMIETIGAHFVYFTIAVLHAYIAFAIWHLPPRPIRPKSGHSVWRDLTEGLRYLRATPVLLMMLLVAVMRMLFVMPYMGLLPAFASKNLHMDATGLGLLTSMGGVGGLASALVLFFGGNINHKGRRLLIAALVCGAALIWMVLMPSLGTVLAGLILIGAAGNMAMVLNTTLMLSLADEAYRGRVMSIFTMQWSLVSIGSLPAGALADVFGVPFVFLLMGIVVLLFYGAMLWRRRDLHTLA